MERLKSRHIRIMTLEDLLIARVGGWKVAELSERLQVNRRTIYRDLDFLQEINVPVWQDESYFGINASYKRADYKLNDLVCPHCGERISTP